MTTPNEIAPGRPLSPALFSSKKQDWETPQDFFDKLNAEFHFTLDVAASHENAKVDHYFTEAHDGLAQVWFGETVWCNPPYNNVAAWIEKAARSTIYVSPPTTVVMLIPARTDTKAWHTWILDEPTARVEVRFVKGRLRFGGSKNSAPFPSAVVIFRSPKPGVL